MGRELHEFDPQVFAAMRLALLGVNHRTAPVEVRERFAVPESRLADATHKLAAFPGVDEAMVISTCNRTELLTSSQNGAPDLRGFLKDYFSCQPGESYLYEYEGTEAVRHLFRVASSL